MQAEKEKNKPPEAAKPGKAAAKVNEEDISPNEYFKLRWVIFEGIKNEDRKTCKCKPCCRCGGVRDSGRGDRIGL